MQLIYKRFILYIFILFLLPSCIYKKIEHNFVAQNIQIPLFLSIPESRIIFESFGPVIYKKIYDYYSKVGYNLSDNKNGGSFILNLKIKDLKSSHKFISPDMLTYNIKVELELLVEAFFDEKFITKKVFKFYAIVPRPKDPVLNESFLEFEVARLMERSVPKIEQYFRKYFLKFVESE